MGDVANLLLEYWTCNSHEVAEQYTHMEQSVETHDQDIQGHVCQENLWAATNNPRLEFL